MGQIVPASTSLPVLTWQVLHSSHKSETAPWILSWLTEIIVRKTVSIVPTSAQKCIGNFPPPLLLSVPRDNGLVARKTRCPLSPNFFIIIISATLSRSHCGRLSWVEYHFFSDPGTEEWPSSWWKSSRLNRNKVGDRFAFLLIVLRSPWDVVEHRHEDDPSCTGFSLICLTWNSWTLLQELQCSESWGHIPLEFNWLTINFVQSSVLWWTLETTSTCPSQTIFNCGFSFIPSKA